MAGLTILTQHQVGPLVQAVGVKNSREVHAAHPITANELKILDTLSGQISGPSYNEARIVTIDRRVSGSRKQRVSVLAYYRCQFDC